MPITIKQVNTTSDESALISMAPTVPLGTDYALICVTMQPNSDQVLDELLFNLGAVQILSECQIRSGVRTIIGIVPTPAIGLAAIAGAFSASCKYTVAVVFIEGVSSVYFTTTGVGDNVVDLPIRVEEKASTLVVGAGVAEGSAQANVEVWQTELWNVSHPSGAFKSQGICRLTDQDLSIVIPNKLNQLASWAIGVVGLEP